jgi:hypothetical protein
MKDSSGMGSTMDMVSYVQAIPTTRASFNAVPTLAKGYSSKEKASRLQSGSVPGLKAFMSF